ncbi:MAG: hypothetical protein LBU18_04780 [Treponema sp.]|jgi:hypothetical protein|nr:hypothetical protein [Treponema sp.]
MTGSQSKGRMPLSRIEFLREKINNEMYLYEAIYRIAQVLSNDILDIPQGGPVYGRQWKKQK